MFAGASCTGGRANTAVEQTPKPPENKPAPKPAPPPTLAEILDKKNTETSGPLGKVDFGNFTYPSPRGWQDIDSKEAELVNGSRHLTEEKVGLSLVAVKYGDATGDGEDEAFVILRVDTGGSAAPHIVYVFTEKAGEPEIIWYFRTGDRADGGLKRVFAEDGELVVELFGQDRYIFNQMETLKIIEDEPQLCCPTDFTRSIYKRTPSGFELSGDRLTFSLAKPSSPPEANLGDKKLEAEKSGKRK